jgi:hypothetical protein
MNTGANAAFAGSVAAAGAPANIEFGFNRLFSLLINGPSTNAI